MADENRNDDNFELAADIREVDGNHDLGAAEIAEKLIERGWGKHPVDKYPRADGDFMVLGPEIFTGAEGTASEGVISWKGENFYRTHDGKPPVVPEVVVEPLSAYKSGDKVSVMKNGDWLPGFVSEKDRVSNHLHINTERGPVTIASTNFIKRRN